MTTITCKLISVAALLALHLFTASIAFAQSAAVAGQPAAVDGAHAADSVIADVGGKTTALKSFGKQLAGAAAQPPSLQVQRKLVGELKEQLKRDPSNPDLNARFESELSKLFAESAEWCKGYAALERPTREHVHAVRNALDNGKSAFAAAAADLTMQANRAADESTGINAELDAAAHNLQQTLDAGKELPAEVDAAVINLDIVAKSIDEDRQLDLSRAAANFKSAANLAKADTLFAQAERVLDRSFVLAIKRQRRVSQLAAVRLDRIREWQLHEKMTDVAGFVAIGQGFADGVIDKEMADAGGVSDTGPGDLTIVSASTGRGAEILRARLAGATTIPAGNTTLVRKNGGQNP